MKPLILLAVSALGQSPIQPTNPPVGQISCWMSRDGKPEETMRCKDSEGKLYRLCPE